MNCACNGRNNPFGMLKVQICSIHDSLQVLIMVIWSFILNVFVALGYFC
jgi:hypothetical protein